MTPRQEAFVREYLVDRCAAKAALRAGYRGSTVRKTASELLAKPAVKAAIDEATKRLAAKLDLSAEKVLANIDRLATKAEKARKFGDAIRAQELLGKHLKLFTEKHEHGGIGGGAVVLQVSSTDEAL